MDAVWSSYHLSSFSRQIAIQFLHKMIADPTPDFDRAKAFLLRKVNGTARPPPNASAWQRGCPELLPGLTARPIWPSDAFPWIPDVEAAFPSILAELGRLRDGERSGFQPYRAPSSRDGGGGKGGVGEEATDRGSWNVLYLSLGSVMKFEENRGRMRETCGVLDGIEGIYGHSFLR
ncbi:hypothetical protein TeGR_g14691 [Tetraparma gracilis]|uniref:Uncharacterized protein n=1 Tax=Tetraparma gracilis TaxID=2962635 RepID=A0ABQ6ME77_9STRA|nr:hypothetical protein TeGR_g14691 [Tetraparma gracilis]